jgi:hypothetical protein
MVFYTFYNYFTNNFDNIYKKVVCYLTGLYYTYITCPNVIKPYRQNATRYTYDYENVLNNFNNIQKSNVYFYDLSNSDLDENNNNHNNDEICYMNVDNNENNNEDINKDYYDHHYYDNNDHYDTKDDKNKNNNMNYDNNKNKAD